MYQNPGGKNSDAQPNVSGASRKETRVESNAYFGISNMISERKQGDKSTDKASEVLETLRKIRSNNTALANIRDKAEDPFRILISTILSARTRDRVTEKVSDQLFELYPDAKSLSRASYTKVAKIVKPVNYYKGKTRKIIAASKQLVSEHGGKVPKTYSELMDLPGVGRKTAGCVLVYGFDLPAIPVDVHVHRISNRIGLVKTKKPDETESELRSLFGEEDWLQVNEFFVSFGQTICLPRKPRCDTCPVAKLCDYAKGKN